MSGKAVARTKAKHARRMHNDVAIVRNFIERLNTEKHDKQWSNIALALIGCSLHMNWPVHQWTGNVGVPPWFWSKIRRIADAQGVDIGGNNSNVKVCWLHNATGAKSTVRELHISYISYELIEFAEQFGIQFIPTHNGFIIPVATRRRASILTCLHKKNRPPKPEIIASTEEIDMKKETPSEFSVDKMLKEVDELQREIDKCEMELREKRVDLSYKKEYIRKHLSNNYSI